MKRRFLLSAATLALPALASGAPAACRVESDDAALVVEITARFEARLEDGRLVRPAGLAPAPPEFLGVETSRRLRAALAERFEGTPVFVLPRGGLDRWGRLPALLAPLDGGTEAGQAMLEAGAGRVEDAREAAPCGEARLAAEAQARQAGVGLWADAYYQPMRAEDRAGLLARAGQFALVEGTIRRVGQGRRRVFLDFGSGRDGFSVTTTRRTKANQTSGLHGFEGLVGRRARARGVIGLFATPSGPAPRIDLSDLGGLELLDAAAPGAAP